MEQASSGDAITESILDCESVVRRLEQHGIDSGCSDETIESISLHIQKCANCLAALDRIAPERTLRPLEERLGREARARLVATGLEGRERADVATVLLVRDGADMSTSGNNGTPEHSCEVVLLRNSPKPAELGQAPEEFGGQFVPGSTLSGSLGTYVIQRLKKTNSFSETYEATVQRFVAGSDVNVQTRVIIRIPRIAVEMSNQAATARLGLLAGLLDVDAQAGRRLSGCKHAAQILDRGEYWHRLDADVSQSVFVVYRHVEGHNLKERMDDEYGRFSGIPEVKHFFRWARQLTAAVLDIHERLVIHGDICPRNIILNGDDDPVLVDFGQSVFVQAMNGSDVYHGHPYRAPEELKNPSTDLFSLGGVLYFLATGSDPHGFSSFADKDFVKQQIEDKIREVNPRLVADGAGVVDVIARCLRTHDRVQHAGQLLQDIEIFEPTTLPRRLVEAVDQLQTTAGELDVAGNALFQSVAAQLTHRLLDTLRDMGRGVLDFSGDSKDICSAACALNSALGDGDEFFATSLPMFWLPGNMGVDGRFLTTTKMAAARGVRIRRLIVLDTDLADEHLEQIIAAQRKVAADLSHADNYSIKCIVMSPGERRRFVREGKHFGVYVRQGDCIAMFPVYNEEGKLVTLRFRTAETIVRGLRDIFDNLAGSAFPIADLELPERARDATHLTS